MIYILTVKFVPEHWSEAAQATIPAGWVGTCPAITFSGGSHLDGEEYPIHGFTRQDVVEWALEHLKERKLHGSLRVVDFR